ncbi:MAG: M56 family metallopeptidase, partial [Candidatus Hydrogenedentes bacterium]|nr:M56 family metallopeptidase [Candidatus Hydrogenedentota bacterium]
MQARDEHRRTGGPGRHQPTRGPALFGFIRPRLLIPKTLLESMSPRELRHVLCHELAHLKRRDILVNWLVAVLQIVHWFNPVMWYAFYRMRADREVACDALALSYLDAGEAQEYGRTVLSLFDTHRRVGALPGVAGILEDKTHLKRRIAMIAAFTKPSRRWTVVALCLFVALGVAGLTEARENDAEQPDSTSSTSSEASIIATPPAAPVETPVPPTPPAG